MLQGWFYFRKYNKTDHWGLRALVGFVLLCDTVQEALICMAVYRYTVTNYGSFEGLLSIIKPLWIEMFFGAALVFAVQTFYCWRIFVLSHNYIISGVGWLFSLTAIVLIYIFTVQTLEDASAQNMVNQQKLAVAWNSVNAIADVYITIAMIYCLKTCKTTDFQKTTDMINRMIIFTFNTGIPTSLCAILGLAFVNTFSSPFVYLMMYLIMDRFYTNCLLVSLNSRKYIRYAGSKDRMYERIGLNKVGGSTAVYPHSFNHAARRNNTVPIQVDNSYYRDRGVGL